MIADLLMNGGFGDVPAARIMVHVRQAREVDDFRDLPSEAVAKISRIRLLLCEIRAAGPMTEATEEAHVVKEMDVTYLPSTVAAYEAIPKSHRSTYDGRLIDQLSILEQRTKLALEHVVDGRVKELSANGRFLQESFASPSSALDALVRA